MQSPFAKWFKGPSKELRLYKNGANRKIKLVSGKEIADAPDLKSFGTRKLKSCARTALKKWKAATIHRVIDTAWTLKKTTVLVVEVNNVREEELSQKRKEKAGTV